MLKYKTVIRVEGDEAKAARAILNVAPGSSTVESIDATITHLITTHAPLRNGHLYDAGVMPVFIGDDFAKQGAWLLCWGRGAVTLYRQVYVTEVKLKDLSGEIEYNVLQPWHPMHRIATAHVSGGLIHSREGDTTYPHPYRPAWNAETDFTASVTQALLDNGDAWPASEAAAAREVA